MYCTPRWFRYLERGRKAVQHSTLEMILLYRGEGKTTPNPPNLISTDSPSQSSDDLKSHWTQKSPWVFQRPSQPPPWPTLDCRSHIGLMASMLNCHPGTNGQPGHVFKFVARSTRPKFGTRKILGKCMRLVTVSNKSASILCSLHLQALKGHFAFLHSTIQS